MIVEKFIHNTFAIIFILLLPQEVEFKINYSSYAQYVYSMVLLGLIQINQNYLSKKLLSRIRSYKMIQRIVSYTLKIIFIYSIVVTFTQLEDYKCSSAFLFGISFFYLYGVQFREVIKQTGLYDFIFTIFIAQMILSLSEEIAYKQFSFKTISLFSPINLLCFVEQLTFHAYQQEELAPQQIQQNSQIHSQNFLSAYKILGREDSFRLIILIFLYVWIFLGVVCFQKDTLVPLIPAVLVLFKFWGVLKKFTEKKFKESFQESRKSYLVFSFFYMLVYVLDVIL